MQNWEPCHSFHSMLAALRRRVAERIAGGEITERGLARQAGISQPHLHNVLKGVRTMTPTVADRLLATLRLNIADLTVPEGGRKNGQDSSNGA